MTAHEEPKPLHENRFLPVPNPTLPYWRTDLHHLDSHRSTPDLPSECDILIIGAGMSGVSVAYHLLSSSESIGRSSSSSSSSKPGLSPPPPPPLSPPSIVLLEARQVCSGATGRNGGHVKVKSASMVSLVRDRGVEEAERFAAFVGAQIHALKDVVERERLDCEFELRRSYDVFVSQQEEEEEEDDDDDSAAAAEVEVEAGWRAALDRGDAWTRDRDRVGAEFAENLTSVRGARAAWSSPACSLWPYKFVTQLLERAMARNPGLLNLQTETPVLAVRYVGEEEAAGGGAGDEAFTIVETPRGSIKARKVVFATNAYTAGLLPQYEGIITPYKGTVAHLAAVPTTTTSNSNSNSNRKGPVGVGVVFPHLSHTYNIEYGSSGGGRGGQQNHHQQHQFFETVDYLNPRPDGGVVVGGGKWMYASAGEAWDDTVDDSTAFATIARERYFEGYMQRNFRGWEDSGTEVDRIWTGIMGRTPDGMPHVGRVPGRENQWVISGFNGGGMPLIYLLGRAVAQMVRDGVAFEDTDAVIPRSFETTLERLNGGRQGERERERELKKVR
ncbi:FAD dependent oxidoreductase superfamily protein [Xylariomycetidae sp. FL2044]|nr:FAD dependent oxidoreductase superfamily protein [Xylariomycetidae sp. FL2044]